MQDRMIQAASETSGLNEGYQIGYFAFRHGITEDQALRLIDAIGPDRRLLDAAAFRLKRQMLPDVAQSESSHDLNIVRPPRKSDTMR